MRGFKLAVNACLGFAMLALCQAVTPLQAETYKAVDLTPAGFQAEAYGCCGTQQVGIYGNDAVVWCGSAVGYVDLNTSGFTSSYAFGTNGTQQVGIGTGPATGGQTHAVLWNGTAGSYTDLNPSGLPRVMPTASMAHSRSAGAEVWSRGTTITPCSGLERPQAALI